MSKNANLHSKKYLNSLKARFLFKAKFIKLALLFSIFFSGQSYAQMNHENHDNHSNHNKIQNTQKTPSLENSNISPILTIVSSDKILANKKQTIKIKLSDKISKNPISDESLKLVHTKKLHLLLVNTDFSDYQHIHPTPTKNNGEYEFIFTPKTNLSYRMWADITLAKNNQHEYLTADLGTINKDKIKIERQDVYEALVDNYNFKLLFDNKLTAGSPSLGTIKVETKDGKPVSNLQPVLGAFAHIVGFYEDFKSIVHIHPMGKEPENDQETAGPEIEFHITPESAGTVKLFAQFKINNKDIFVPLTINVNNSLALNY
jgi:hypothetical protein